MTTTNATHIHAARILKSRHAAYRWIPLAEIVLAVAATAVICPNASNAFQLARDTVRSENGHEAKRRELSNMGGAHRTDGVSVDYLEANVRDGRDDIGEIEHVENVRTIAEKIRVALGADISDGLAEGIPLRDIATILGTSAPTLCRRIAEVRAILASELV